MVLIEVKAASTKFGLVPSHSQKEFVLSKRSHLFHIFMVTGLFITGCSALVVKPRPDEASARRAVTYEGLLGKSIDDKDAAKFLSRNNCESSGQYQVCQSAGLTLWAESDLIVKTIRLYINNSDGFALYQGNLPFGLRFYDIMGAVEYKLKRQGVENEGRPDEGSSPDHFHYWAVYKQYGMIIIYNSPYADEDATIHSILISRQFDKMASGAATQVDPTDRPGESLDLLLLVGSTKR